MTGMGVLAKPASSTGSPRCNVLGWTVGVDAVYASRLARGSPKEGKMFGALKDKAVSKAVTLFEADFRARIADKIDLFTNLKPTDVHDDRIYTRLVVDPLWLYIKLQSAGALSALQKLSNVDVEQRFRNGLFLVRNELIQTEGEAVNLDPNFKEKVAPDLIRAFQDKG